MKTRLLIIIGIFLISTIGILFSYSYVIQIFSDEHYEIEITGLKDTYTLDEVYSFNYHVTGYGYGCAAITVTYTDEEGEILTTRSEPLCDVERNLGIINTRSHQGPLGNIAIKIPGTYEISVTYDPVGSFLSETVTKQFEIIDDFDATFGGPGNRHPAFLGYEIPEICTFDMIKHLVKYSNMFFDDEENFSFEWIGLHMDINADDFDVCYDELLELRNHSQESEKQS